MSELKPEAASAAPRCRPVVLVVEPDRPIRALIKEWLELAGYDFLDGQGTGPATSDVARSDILLVDIRAPLRSARQQIADLAAKAPRAALVAMSADALASGRLAMEAVARELGVAAVLVKPFGREALMQALQQAQPPA
jgi:CheY-like chemotaxis protein